MADEKSQHAPPEEHEVSVEARSGRTSEVFVPGGHDARRIAVEARCGVRAVRSLYRGDRVRELTRIRILEAVARLGLPPPGAIAQAAAEQAGTRAAPPDTCHGGSRRAQVDEAGAEEDHSLHPAGRPR